MIILSSFACSRALPPVVILSRKPAECSSVRVLWFSWRQDFAQLNATPRKQLIVSRRNDQ